MRSLSRSNRSPGTLTGLISLEEVSASSSSSAWRRHGLIVTERGSGKTLRICVHPMSSSSFVQWVTALYIARLETSPQNEDGDAVGAEEHGARRAKRVTFNEETEAEQSGFIDSSAWRETVDLGELFYSREDLAGFRKPHIKDLNAISNKIPGRRIVHSLVSKLRRKATRTVII